MLWTEIKLPTGVFKFDPARPLGKRGGFGQVFAGEDSNGQPIAVKQLHASGDALVHRELNISAFLKSKTLQHVMPVIDSGNDPDRGLYFVVMPRAEGSLQNEIERSGPKGAKDAANIMLQVAKGLEAVPEIVHRDLKPDNVLFYEGAWRIADFGIAKFVEDSTSDVSLKNFRSPYYAAPEQWDGVTPSPPTDIYALGCIGFFLLTGTPPFTHDPRTQHQTEPLPIFTSSDPRLDQCIHNMVRKPPGARPSRLRVLSVLESIQQSDLPISPAHPIHGLSAVSARVAAAEQAAQAAEGARARLTEERHVICSEAISSLQQIAKRLAHEVGLAAPSVRVEDRTPSALQTVSSRHGGPKITNH